MCVCVHVCVHAFVCTYDVCVCITFVFDFICGYYLVGGDSYQTRLVIWSFRTETSSRLVKSCVIEGQVSVPSSSIDAIPTLTEAHWC